MSGLGVRRAKAALSDYCFAVSATLSSSHNPTSNSADFERGSKTNVPQKRRSARQPKRCHAWSIQCGDAGQAHCRGREASYSGRRMAGKDSHMGLACDPCRDQGVWRGRVMSTRVDPAELGNVAAQLLFLTLMWSTSPTSLLVSTYIQTIVIGSLIGALWRITFASLLSRPQKSQRR